MKICLHGMLDKRHRSCPPYNGAGSRNCPRDHDERLEHDFGREVRPSASSQKTHLQILTRPRKPWYTGTVELGSGENPEKGSDEGALGLGTWG